MRNYETEYSKRHKLSYKFKRLFKDSLGLTALGFGLIVGSVLTVVISLGIYVESIRVSELISVGCEHTPVNWANNTFYVTDEVWACPYQVTK